LLAAFLLAYVTNFFFAGMGESSWRWIAGFVMIIPAALLPYFSVLFRKAHAG
jgi:hypothetical protein